MGACGRSGRSHCSRTRNRSLRNTLKIFTVSAYSTHTEWGSRSREDSCVYWEKLELIFVKYSSTWRNLNTLYLSNLHVHTEIKPHRLSLYIIVHSPGLASVLCVCANVCCSPSLVSVGGLRSCKQFSFKLNCWYICLLWQKERAEERWRCITVNLVMHWQYQCHRLCSSDLIIIVATIDLSCLFFLYLSEPILYY